MDTFSKRMKALRLEAGLKQTDLAERLHSTGATISTYENGREPAYDVLVSIARELHVSTDYLLGVSHVRQPASDALASAINGGASSAEACGARVITSDDLRMLFEQLRAYAGGDLPAGTRPVNVTHQLIGGMTAILSALNADSAGEVIDATNQVLTSVLEVNSILTAYLTRKKEE